MGGGITCVAVKKNIADIIKGPKPLTVSKGDYPDNLNGPN